MQYFVKDSQPFPVSTGSPPTRSQVLTPLSPHLKGDDNHENFFVFIWQDMFNESPARANKGNSDEQKSTLQSERETDTAVRGFILSHFLLCPVLSYDSKATNPNTCLAIHNFGKCLSCHSEADVLAYNCVSHSNITLHSQLSICAIFSWGSHPFTIVNRREHWQLYPLTIHTKNKLDTWILAWTKKRKAFLLLLLLHPHKYQFSAAALSK